MTHKPHIADLPRITDVTSRKMENDGGSGCYYYFAVFRWHKQSYTLLGRNERRPMPVDGGLLRVVGQRKRTPVRLLVDRYVLPITFSVVLPKTMEGQRLVFAGFNPRSLIDLDLFASEDKRLCEYYPDPLAGGEPPEKIPRPPAGLII